MTNGEDLQEVLRQNLRVLLAMQRMTHADLATRLGTDRATVTKNMNGHRKWSLQDLVILADIFGVTAPGLIGDTASLVSAVNPGRTGTDGVSGPDSALYGSTNRGTGMPLTLVPALGPRYDHEERMAAVLAMPTEQWVNHTRASRGSGHLVAVATG